MIKRIIIAIIACPIIYFIIMAATPWPFYLFITAVFSAGLIEIYCMFKVKKMGSFMYIGLGAAVITYLLTAYAGNPAYMFYVSAAMVMVLLSIILITKNVERDMPKVLNTVFPFAYLTALGTFFILIRKLPQGNYWIFSLIMFTWIYDAGAYFTGVAFGRHKLIAELSPKKSVEGFIGGIIVNIAAAVILRMLLFKEFFQLFPMAHLIILAVLLSFTGQAGDIAESVIKRYTGVKNSSNLLPEMGGVMDKIDSLLFNAPVIYFYIKFLILKH